MEEDSKGSFLSPAILSWMRRPSCLGSFLLVSRLSLFFPSCLLAGWLPSNHLCALALALYHGRTLGLSICLPKCPPPPQAQSHRTLSSSLLPASTICKHHGSPNQLRPATGKTAQLLTTDQARQATDPIQSPPILARCRQRAARLEGQRASFFFLPSLFLAHACQVPWPEFIPPVPIQSRSCQSKSSPVHPILSRLS